MAWSVAKQTSPASPVNAQITLSLNPPLISTICNLHRDPGGFPRTNRSWHYPGKSVGAPGSGSSGMGQHGTAQLALGTAGLGHKHIQLGHPAPATCALQLCNGWGRQDPRDLSGRGLSAHIFKLFRMQKREGENWVIILEREEQLLQHVGWSLTGGILQ